MRVAAIGVGSVLMAASTSLTGWWWVIPFAGACLVLGVRGSSTRQALILGAMAGAVFAVAHVAQACGGVFRFQQQPRRHQGYQGFVFGT